MSRGAFPDRTSADSIRAMAARIAVLASGGGTNLQAILDYLASLGTAASGAVVLVLSDKSTAGALERARARGIDAVVVDPTTDMLALLEAHRIELIALAGYLKLVPSDVTQRYRGRIVNVHPALLPSFGGPGMYGGRVHRAVLASGARVSGVTVHFVDEVYDQGAIIAQWPVPVFGHDTGESLAARVLEAEHMLYPRVVEALAGGRVSLVDNRASGLLDTATEHPHHFALADQPVLPDL
jgi:formyltetrahydrofolate-dependent phosphoribosylglycinamide formyltransferase